MKRVVLLAVLMLALPIAAFANGSLIFANTGGTLKLSSTTLVGNANLTSFTSSSGTITGALGHVSYTTGAELSRVLTASTDTFTFAGGGSFKISSNGSGLPSGLVFSGTFSSPVSFQGTFNPAGDNGLGAWTYTLTGQLSGTLGSKLGGSAVTGGTFQVTFDVPGHGPYSGFVRGKNGTTTVAAVPEPGTLGLLGTGLIGVAGLVRRKFRGIS